MTQSPGRKWRAAPVLVGVALSLIIGLVYAQTTDLVALTLTAGVYLSLVVALLLLVLDRQSDSLRADELTRELSQTPELESHVVRLSPLLRDILGWRDETYRSLFAEMFDKNVSALSAIARGVFQFRAESWRIPYREILSRPDVRFYWSVAVVKSPHYWRDPAAQDSIEFNKTLPASMAVHRVFVLWDSLWTNAEMYEWIRDQAQAQISVSVVQRSAVPPEEDVLHDIGIYGDVAVGHQLLDVDGRTADFLLSFDRESIRLFKERFRRLGLYATQATTRQYFESHGERFGEVK